MVIHMIDSYINAVFQALYFCSPFRDLVIATIDSSVTAPLQSPQMTHVALPLTSSPPSQSPSKTPWSARAGLKRRDSTNIDSSDHPTNAATSEAPTAPPIPSNPSSLFSALRSLFIHIAQNPLDNGKVPPTAFVRKVKDDNEAFRNNNHQDAHELLNFLLNQVVEDLETISKNGNKLHCMLKSFSVLQHLLRSEQLMLKSLPN